MILPLVCEMLIEIPIKILGLPKNESNNILGSFCSIVNVKESIPLLKYNYPLIKIYNENSLKDAVKIINKAFVTTQAGDLPPQN